MGILINIYKSTLPTPPPPASGIWGVSTVKSYLYRPLKSAVTAITDGIKNVVLGEEEEDEMTFETNQTNGNEDKEGDDVDEGTVITYVYTSRVIDITLIAISQIKLTGHARWKGFQGFKNWLLPLLNPQPNPTSSPRINEWECTIIMSVILGCMDGLYDIKNDWVYVGFNDLTKDTTGVYQVRDDVVAEVEITECLKGLEGKVKDIGVRKLEIVKKFRTSKGGPKGEHLKRVLGILIKREDEIRGNIINLENIMAGVEKGRDNKVVIESMKVGLEAVRKLNASIGGVTGVDSVMDEVNIEMEETEFIGEAMGRMMEGGEEELEVLIRDIKDEEEREREREKVIKEREIKENKEREMKEREIKEIRERDTEIKKETEMEEKEKEGNDTTASTTPSKSTPVKPSPTTPQTNTPSRLGPPLRVPVIE